MAIPTATPSSSGTGGLLALRLLLALLGGEYYLLTARGAQLHPTPAMLAQAARATAEGAWLAWHRAKWLRAA